MAEIINLNQRRIEREQIRAEMDDPLRAARGITTAVLITGVMWLVIWKLWRGWL